MDAPDQIFHRLQSARSHLGQLLVLEFANTLNEGLCRGHLQRCPGVREDSQFKAECGYAETNGEAIRVALRKLGAIRPEGPTDTNAICHDNDSKCSQWEGEGNCDLIDSAQPRVRCCQ